MNGSLISVFEGNKWVRAWLNAPDEAGRDRVMKDMHSVRERIGGEIARTRPRDITDGQLKDLRAYEVASCILYAPDPGSDRTAKKVARALNGIGFPNDGYLPSKQFEILRDEERGSPDAQDRLSIRAIAGGLEMRFHS